MSRSAIFISILFLWLSPAYRLAAQFKFEKSAWLSRDNGLPSNDIRVVTKSQDGFIWIGTHEGLCRFDGIQFHNYKPEEGNPHSMFSKDISAVLPDGKQVWLGTSMGISVLDIYTGKFRNYQLTAKGKSDSVTKRAGMEVSALCKDKAGDIWIGTRQFGICRYDRKKDDFVFYPYRAPDTMKFVPAGYNTVLSLEYSRSNDSIIYGGTIAGLLEINKYSGRVNRYYFTNEFDQHYRHVNAFRRLYFHDDGLLYAGTWRAGVNVFNPKDGSLHPLVDQKHGAEELLQNAVGSIVRKSEHEMWITTSAGLILYNSAAQQITWRKANQILEGVFYGVEYVDENNRTWCTHMNGISIFDPLMQQFRIAPFSHLFSKGKWAFSFDMIFDTASNTIVTCPRFGDGVYFYHRDEREWSWIPYSLNGKPLSLTVRGFGREKEGVYTISSDEGLFRFTVKTKKLEPLKLDYPFEYRRYGPLSWDKKGRLWLCADTDGLICWDPATNQFKAFRKEMGLLRPGVQVFSINGLFIDSRNNVWVRRMGGYSVYIDAKDTLINFLAQQEPAKTSAMVHDFAEDHEGRVWISGVNGAAGYALADNPAKGMVHQMTWQSGGMYMEDNYHWLDTDKSGNIWGCSDKQLIKVNTRDFSTTTFDFRYGVDHPEFFGFIILPDDELVMGARNGIILGNPHELRRNAEPPRPYLTGVQVQQQPYRGSIPLFGEMPLEFKYWQNFFSFSFSAQAYSLGKETRFRYRLKGFDDWQETSGRYFANYTNVPGGEYVFQLQAANNEGQWNEQILSVPVVIETAWWANAWFYVILVIALLSFSWWLYKRRIRQVKNREYIRSEFEKKLANVEMSALRAQMNPHFLFNSLNSIDSYIIRNESKKASEYLNNFARLIRLILQNSRSNYISLKDELETLELYLQMETLRFKGKFEYELHVPDNLDTAAIDIPPMLIQPYVENAIWHGLMHQQDPGGGKVKVSIQEKEGMLLCIVEDNGIGRKKAMELKAKKSGIARRSMGMVITQDRMEIINKLYDTQTAVQVTDLEDEKGNAAGTRVVLTIPV
jgi:ligand-binding sensor domain-containing protein